MQIYLDSCYSQTDIKNLISRATDAYNVQGSNLESNPAGPLRHCYSDKLVRLLAQ